MTVDVQAGVVTCLAVFVNYQYTFASFQSLMEHYNRTLINAIERAPEGWDPRLGASPYDYEVRYRGHRRRTGQLNSYESDRIVRDMRVVRVNLNSPLEIILSTPIAQASAVLAGLMALPRLIRRFSRLRVDLKQDRLEQALWEGSLREYKEALPSDPSVPVIRRGMIISTEEQELDERLQTYAERSTAAACQFLVRHVDRMVVEAGETIADSDDMDDN